jgi:putative CRISPR-associated protein (TIGR02619 family)
MKEVVLVTCGTSLASNAYRQKVELRYFPADPSITEPGSYEDQLFGKSKRKSSRLFIALLKFLKKNPQRASAEINTFEKFRISHKEIDSVILYHSDSGLGHLCSSVLREYVSQRYRIAVKTVEVLGFGTPKTLEQFREGMMNLMSQIVKDSIKFRRSGHDVYLLATAGYKPEVTAAVIGALLCNVNGIYYLHESVEDVVFLPKIPLILDPSKLNRLKKAFMGGNNIVMREKTFDEIAEIDYEGLKKMQDEGLVELVDSDKVKIRDWVYELLLT